MNLLKDNCEFITTIIMAISLIVTIIYNAKEVRHSVEASKATRFALEYQLLVHAKQRVNEATYTFNNEYKNELENYLTNKANILSSDAWDSYYFMMNSVEQLAMIINTGKLNLEGMIEPTINGMTLTIEKFFKASKKKDGQETVKFLEDYYPQILTLIKSHKQKVFNDLRIKWNMMGSVRE